MKELEGKVDCENIAGTNAEIRFCLNKDFQKKDSVLNAALSEFFTQLSEDQRKYFSELHQQWIIYRRSMSEIQAQEAQGPMLGIIYLSTMIRLTEIKTEEIRFLSGDIED